MTPALAAPRPARGPWQRLYAAVLARRRELGRRSAVRLPRPTISVGNLHWGGTGKTPLVAALADHLGRGGKRVAVLSRGYRRRGRAPLLVSTGGGPVVGWRDAGDEPFWLAQRLAGVTVAVGADRAAAASLALRSGPVDVFVLDDAFSHVRVARDVNLLVFPAGDPFAGGRLLPSGRLREPLAASAAADAVLLTGLSSDELPRGQELASELRRFGFGGEGFGVAETARVTAVTSSAVPARGDRVVLVTGVARPHRVAATAARLGLVVAEHLAFPDHHGYPERSLERVRRAARRQAAPVLTTAKDAMKLAPRLSETFVLDLVAGPEPGFWSWLDTRLAAMPARDRLPGDTSGG